MPDDEFDALMFERTRIALSIEQRERAGALRAAATVLREAGLREYTSNDIIDVAFWINTGIDPSDVRLQHRRRAASTFPDAAEWRAEDAPRCQNVSDSPWGSTQCVLPVGHTERHAYSPSESIEGS